MKVKYNNRFIILFSLLFMILGVRAQKRSAAFYEIVGAKNYTDTDKKSEIEILLKKHMKNKDSLQYGIDLTAFSYWLYNHGYFYESISKSEKAVDFYKTYAPYNKKLHIGNLRILGRSYSNTKDYTNSNRAYFEIIKLKNTNGGFGVAYQNIAENYQAEGNFHTASSYYEKAIEEFNKEKKDRKLFNTIINSSINYQKILDDKSIKKGIAQLKTLDSLKSKVNFDLYDEFLINETLGNLHNYENLFDTYICLPYYKKALSVAKKLKNNRLISSVYRNIGNIYYKVNNDSALFYFNEALKPTYNNIVQTARIHYMIGLTNVDKKKYNRAYESFSKSLYTLRSKQQTTYSTDKSLHISILKQLSISLIKKYENAEASKKYIEEALTYLKEADELIDLIKLENTHRASKLFWREQASDLYINLVKIYQLLNDPKSAYFYLEKNKALLLLEDLTEERSKDFFNIPEHIVQRERLLKRKIAKAQNDLDLSEKDQGESIILFDKKEEYEQFIDSLRYTYPKYYQSKNNTNIVSFKQTIKEAKRRNATFIHYILNDDVGYVLVIAENKQLLYPLDSVSVIRDQTNTFKEFISKPFYDKKDQRDFNSISKELSNKLLPDDLINNNIIIVPDQNLQSLPFEALIKKDGEYLIEDYNISYAYSISFLQQNKDLKRTYQKELLGFAPIEYTSLPTLPNSDKEVNTITQRFESDILLHQKASKKNLVNSLPNYKIIHLSAHANANDSITPWIATSTNNITLNDIYSTKNNAELVTLSACNTSLGKLQKGEGVMSLARGFFNTGANSVISTLWKADDKSTQEIITGFYTYLKKGKSKPKALRQAKLDYLKNHSLSEVSPYYWSSLVLIGNPEPLYPSMNAWYILIGVLISSLIIFLIYKKIAKK
ncbi:CHAT domain-containing protein [uncultured Aquimarina sp.]|uniref:CHAT domain-containing protein n=1 Tax=uncultured Aquimarina sp. TaxID=575652 RepID=UPI0026289550|nr:CHAT domain-containing protein [uncultured Aquimarina sp.]